MAHGLVQGGISSVTGGDFLSGFLAGAFSSAAGSLWKADYNGEFEKLSRSGAGIGEGLGFASDLRSGTGGALLFGAVTGGLGSVIGGGNFWQGAATGLIVVGFNHLANHLAIKAEQKRQQESQEARAKRIIAEAKAHAQKNPDLYKDTWGYPDLLERNYDCYTLANDMTDGILNTNRIMQNSEFEVTLKTSFTETKTPTKGSIVTYRNSDGVLNHASIYLGNNTTFAKPGNILPPAYSTISSESATHGKIINYYNPK